MVAMVAARASSRGVLEAHVGIAPVRDSLAAL
jgi:hypothetical protein